MQSTFQIERDKRTVKRWLLFCMLALFITGITAMPAKQELSFARKFFDDESSTGKWVNEVLSAITETDQKFPYLFYGYDWLAFAHFVLAILFIGPYKDPVKNKWVIEFGVICCWMIIPFALVSGFFRGIPFWWRLVDCSFGIVGLVPLGICYKKINGIDNWERENEQGLNVQTDSYTFKQ